MKKKRNPNDATFRNINALKKRVSELEILVAFLFGYTGAVPGRYKPKRKGGG